MKKTNPTFKSSTRIIALFLIVVLLVIGFVVYKGRHSNQGKKTATTPLSTNNATPQEPYTASSEGSQFTVPKDVPKDAIKDYQLITENEQYKIRFFDGTYTVTLYAIINNPSQYDQYQQQLREYKKNALDYMTAHNIDINKVKITYEPPEATQL